AGGSPAGTPPREMIIARGPPGSARSAVTMDSGEGGGAGGPQLGQGTRPPLGESRGRGKEVSGGGAAGGRALRSGFFCSSATAGRICSILSTSGRSTRSRNILAYVDSDSM